MIDENFPLIDLHRHLDGNIRLETIIDLGRQNGIDLPAWYLEELRPYVQVTDPTQGVMAFIAKFKWMMAVLVDTNACRRVAYENVEDALKEGLDYVELRFSPWFMAETHGLDPEGVVEAVCAGIQQGKDAFEMPVNLIGVISRTYGVDIAWKELDALLAHKECLVAIDLAGDEANYPGEMFVDHFSRVQEEGLSVVAHAGESVDSSSIWQAIRELGAVRIGHAVSAVDDPELMEYMRANKIGIESNLTSNLQTSTIQEYSQHPIKKFLELGLLTNLNSDDPGISGIDLRYEYEVAAPLAGLTEAEISQAQKNALEIAFLSPEEKQMLKDKAMSR